MAEKKSKKKGEPERKTALEGKYAPFKMPDRPKPEAVDPEILNARIEEAQDKLRAMGLEREVWLKNPLSSDPSYHLCFSMLEDEEGVIMLQQIAGESLRLLDAPPYLKQSGVKQLDELVEFAPIAQQPPEEEGAEEEG